MAEEESFPVGAVEYLARLDLFPSEAIRLRGQPWNVGGGGEGGSDGSEEVHQLACPCNKAEAVEETVTGGIRWQAASLSGHPDGCQGGDLVSPFVDVGEGCFAARIAGEAFTDPFLGDPHACDRRDEIRVRHPGLCEEKIRQKRHHTEVGQGRSRVLAGGIEGIGEGVEWGCRGSGAETWPATGLELPGGGRDVGASLRRGRSNLGALDGCSGGGQIFTAEPQEDDADEDSDQEQLRGAHEKP